MENEMVSKNKKSITGTKAHDFLTPPLTFNLDSDNEASGSMNSAQQNDNSIAHLEVLQQSAERGETLNDLGSESYR